MEKYGDDEQQRPAPLIWPARRVASAARGEKPPNSRKNGL
jgi:hypothetical protein